MTDDRDMLFEQQMGDYNYLRELYRSGKIGGLNQYERELLEFCHNTDMPKYLKENVWDKPIVLNGDGSLNMEKTVYRSSKQELLAEQSTYQQPQMPAQQTYQPMPPVTPQKFYYLYDDNGNLIAAIPQK